MYEQDAPLEVRLYGVMQNLMRLYADRESPESPPPRGVVEQQDAVEAVLQIAAVIDEHTQAGAIPAERGAHAASMLMLLRDYVRPLPRGIGRDGNDRLTEDLRKLTRMLQEARNQTGLRG